MRVIGGKYKSRQLKSVDSNLTRPTTDRNKENLFNLLMPYLKQGIVLDLFAGSGGLGIEALSRGYQKLYSIDNQFKAIKTIKENKSILNLKDEMIVIKNDYLKAINYFNQEKIKFDLVFLDPPYNKEMALKSIKLIDDFKLLNNDAIIVVEDLAEVKYDLPKKFKLLKEKEYGITKILILRYGEGNE